MALGIALSALLLAGCGDTSKSKSNAAEPTAGPAAKVLTFAGKGRDRVCLDQGGGRAGFITYGARDTNCSASGTLEQDGQRVVIVPDGDTQCRIEATLSGVELRLGRVSPACRYYCAPGASFAGRTLRQAPGTPVTDVAGDPLC